MIKPRVILLWLLAVSCSSSGEPGGSNLGGIRVTTISSGTEIDADGYSLTLDGVLDVTIGANASKTRSGLEPGTYAVDIANVAGNCSVAQPRLKNVTVTEDQTSTADFAVTCFATTGTLTLQINAGGYFYDIDPVLTYQIDIQTARFTHPGLDSSFSQAVGQHAVTLGQVAANCSDPNGYTRNFAITPAGQTVVTFDLTCSAITGRLWITILMGGANPDADGYFISLDGKPPGRLGSENSSVEYLTLAPGPHSTVLTGVASNCILTGSASRQYTVVAGQQTADTMNLDCP